MTINLLPLSFLVKKYGRYKQVPSNPLEYRFCCPYCVNIGKPPDRKFHLYINLKLKVGYCFRCGKVLKFKKKDLRSQPKVYFLPTNKPIKNFSFLQEIPKHTSLFNHQRAYKFMMNKLSKNYPKDYIEDFIKKYELSVCIDKRFSSLYDRIMIPIKFNGNIVGFQFRTIYGEEPKYLTFGYNGYNVKDFVFNFDTVSDYISKNQHLHLSIYIVEGVFDILPIKEQAIAVFGKNITQKQLSILQLLPVKKIVIMFDSDAIEDAKSIAWVLSKNFSDVYIARLPDGVDPCDYGFNVKNVVISSFDIFEL